MSAPPAPSGVVGLLQLGQEKARIASQARSRAAGKPAPSARLALITRFPHLPRERTSAGRRKRRSPSAPPGSLDCRILPFQTGLYPWRKDSDTWPRPEKRALTRG